jgi:hypothetical protein
MPVWFPGIVDASDYVDKPPPTSWKRPLLVLFGVVGVMLVLLRTQGRFWICTCGRIDLWAGDIWSANNSQHIADPYTLTHVLHGILFAWLIAIVLSRMATPWKVVVAASLESAWEVVENSRFVIDRYREATIALGYQGDTIINSVSDVGACVLGFLVVRWIGLRWSIAFFLSVELVLVLWIRDSLILNIIMLIYPIEAIREWQMAAEGAIGALIR